MEKIDGHGQILGEMRTRLEDARTEIRGQSVVLEDMRSQNRTTIEAVHARCDALESEMHDGFARLDGISSDVQGLKVDVQGLKGDVKEVRTDLRRVETKVERLESRFNAFDHRP
jgi:archaellum component FlaC